jgi:hypothetical protein
LGRSDDLLSELDAAAQGRSDSIERWITTALTKPDPAEWVESLVSDALRRLDGVDSESRIKKQAKEELLGIRRDILAGIEEHRS